METRNLGRVAFFDKGVYSEEETYNKWDFVTTMDSTYLFIALTPQIGKPVADTSFWKCIANGKPATLAAAAAEIAKSEANNAAALANAKAGLADAAALLATDKASLANSAATLANEKAGLANSAATLANNKTSEFAAAEGVRVNAESSRAGAEGLRVSAEATRQSNESARVNAESARNVASNVYNVTLSVPLSAGQFYTLATAIAAVVVELRKKGLTITFEISNGVWKSYQFSGSTTATWTTIANWVETQTNKAEITELLELPLSEALNVLYAKIQALESFIKSSQYSNVTADQVDIVKNFNIWGKTNLIIEGTTAPAITPDFIGQTFINTTAGITYTAKGIASAADWKQTSN